MSLVAASRLASARGDEGDRVYCARRGNFDPATALAVSEVCSLLEPELVKVELQRSALIANRDEYGPNLADSGRVGGYSDLSFPALAVRFRLGGSAFFFVVMMISPLGQAVKLQSGRPQGEAPANLSRDEIDQ